MSHSHPLPKSQSRRQFLQLGCGCAGGAILTGLTGCATAESIGMSLVQDDQLMAMGLKTWEGIKQEEKISTSPAANRRVKTISERLLRTNGFNTNEWEIVVFDSKQLNAFALPNKKIGVYTGLLDLTDDDAELATVIGHEIGHVSAQHAKKRVGTSALLDQGLTLGQVGLATAGVQGGELLNTAIQAGVGLGILLPYSRRQELEADAVGLNYMARAGYNPTEAIEFWGRMAAKSGKGNQPEIAKYFSTHPADGDRIAAIRRLLPGSLAIYRQAS